MNLRARCLLPVMCRKQSGTMNEYSAWVTEEEETSEAPKISSKVIDLAFQIRHETLPVDHAELLSNAVTSKLPWLIDEPLAGLHLIHVAGSQNGWMRPEEPDALLYLSRRTRLVIRIPLSRLADAMTLSHQTLDLDGKPMMIGKAAERPVLASEVLFSRHVMSAQDESEPNFIQRVTEELESHGIACKKILPGREIILTTPLGKIHTRSLLLADIRPTDSLTLQEQGLGEGRYFGCGLFIPHKGLGT